MQEIYNAGWYASNEVCSWPFTKTLYSVDGSKLSDSIISDLHIVTNQDGTLYLSGVQVSDSFVSVVISSESGIAASVTLKQPVNIHRNYVLNTFVPGLSGTVAFGHGVLIERGSWHFAPGVNLLDSSCIHLTSFPVTSLSVKDGTPLTGRVILSSGTDLSIESCVVSLGATRADGAESTEPEQYGIGYKISLSADAASRSTSAASQSEILESYCGPCSVRPENNDCPYITEINGVTPDSHGNINIKAEEGLSLGRALIPAENILAEDDVEDCAKNGLYSHTVLVSADDPYEPFSTGSPVRRCGNDLCAEGSDSGNNSSQNGSSEGSSGESEGSGYNIESWTIRSVAQSVRILPRDDNYGVVYRGETDTLEPAGNGPAYVYFSLVEHSQVYAAFELLDDYDCGIIFNLDVRQPLHIRLFRFKDEILTLGSRQNTPVTTTVGPHTKISLELAYIDGFFRGTLSVYSDYNVYSKKLAFQGVKSDLFGLYMRNCKCLMWSEK